MRNGTAPVPYIAARNPERAIAVGHCRRPVPWSEAYTVRNGTAPVPYIADRWFFGIGVPSTGSGQAFTDAESLLRRPVTASRLIA